MDVGHIQMTIDRGAGELAYRQYHSNNVVDGAIYIFASKLTPEDEVFYRLHIATVHDGGKTKKLAEQTVSMARFQEVIKELAEKLSLIEPDTEFVENHDGHMAIAKVEDGTGEEKFKVVSGKELRAMSSLQRLKDRMDKVGSGESIEIKSPEDALEIMKGIAEMLAENDGETQMFLGKVDKDDEESIGNIIGKIDNAQKKVKDNKPEAEDKQPSKPKESNKNETSSRISKFME